MNLSEINRVLGTRLENGSPETEINGVAGIETHASSRGQLDDGLTGKGANRVSIRGIEITLQDQRIQGQRIGAPGQLDGVRAGVNQRECGHLPLLGFGQKIGRPRA